jgi:DNA-binding HxlR family transcriptional regulator
LATCEEAIDVVRLLAGKWTLSVIAKLHERPMRHNQLRKALGDNMSDKMLTRVLRRLEQSGVVSRHVTIDAPPGVEYRLLPFGRSLLDPLAELAERWRDSPAASVDSEHVARVFAGP